MKVPGLLTQPVAGAVLSKIHSTVARRRQWRTLADVISGCVTSVAAGACSKLLSAATPPTWQTLPQPLCGVVEISLAGLPELQTHPTLQNSLKVPKPHSRRRSTT